MFYLILMAFCAVFYKADWKQCIFFSGLNYSLLFLTDLFMLQMENMFVSDNDVLMFFCKSAEAKVQTAYLFLSVGLIFINIVKRAG